MRGQRGGVRSILARVYFIDDDRKSTNLRIGGCTTDARKVAAQLT